MGNRDNTNLFALSTVDQRIREIVKRQHSRPVRGSCAHRRMGAQQRKRLIECVGKILYGDKRTVTDVPVRGGIRIGFCFAAKADPHPLWQQQFWRVAWS